MTLTRAIGEVDALEQTLGVLDAGLSRQGGLARTDAARKVPHNAEPPRSGLGQNREVGIAGYPAVNLEEVHARLLERIDGATGVLGRLQGDAIEGVLLRPIEERARAVDAWPEQGAARDLGAQAVDDGEVATHVANPGYSINGEQRH